VYRTDWSDFIIKDSDGNKINPLNGRPISEGKLEDTTQVRLGTEYLFIREKSIIPLRFGLFYDPEPALDSPDDFYGFSFGTGYARGRIAFDAAYQYRTGNNVTGDLPAVEDSSADIDQHIFMLSAIFYFK
jgi:long-subunit fatty acid transport protein